MMRKWFILGLTATITSCSHLYYDLASNEILSYTTSKRKNEQLIEIDKEIKSTEDKIKRWEPHVLSGDANSTERSIYLEAFEELHDLKEKKQEINRRETKD